MRAWVVFAVVGGLVCSCAGGRDETLTIYLPQRLGPDGPAGQIAPVLMPVERERRDGMPAAWQAILELRVGPSPEERASGFDEAIPPATRLRRVGIAGGSATVELAGKEPGFVATAAIVYSLTELEDVETVRLRLAGRRCCIYTHANEPLPEVSRRTFRGWAGEPCHLRTWRIAVRCRNTSRGTALPRTV